MELTKSNPLVSVIVPVFNQKEEYLRICIESILNQTYSNFELIISDNHSDNGSWDVINSYIDNRVTVVRPPTHLPMVQHWQYATFNVKTDFITIMGSDDWAEPQWLSEMMTELVSYPTASFAFPNLILNFLKEGNRKNARASEIQTQLIPSVQAANQVAEWTSPMFSWWIVGAVIRSKDYFSVSGIARYATVHNGDYPLSLGLLSRGDVLYINKPLVNYRIWGEDDGKADGKREMVALSDMVKIVTCIKLDQSVLTMLKKSGWSIARIRIRFIRLALSWLSDGLIKNTFTKEEKNKIVEDLAMLSTVNIIPRVFVSIMLFFAKIYRQLLMCRVAKRNS